MSENKDNTAILPEENQLTEEECLLLKHFALLSYEKREEIIEYALSLLNR